MAYYLKLQEIKDLKINEIRTVFRDLPANLLFECVNSAEDLQK